MKARFPRFRAVPGRPPAQSTTSKAPSWQARALDAIGTVWLRIGADLRVVDASPAARELFTPEPLPQRLIAMARIPRLEGIAHEVLAGATGPWELDARHYRRILLLHGVPLGLDGALLHFQDVSDLRRLEAVRADFVANLAHELRTPVASLSLAAETLSGDLPASERRQFVDRIADEARYIEGILRTVTDLALLEGTVTLQLAPLELRSVVAESWQRVVDRLGPATFLNSVVEPFPVVADRIRVLEVFQNLLDNAHRYTTEGGTVEVGAERRENEVEIFVRDDGPGIPPADLDRVFERFYKVDRARTRRGDGSGLGLALSKHLVTAHGGAIWAEAAPGGGTVIRFTLPASA